MTATQRVLEVMQASDYHVREVIKRAMRLHSMNQTELGEVIGLNQGQMSWRLRHTGSLSYSELAGIATFFGVTPATFEKPMNEAVADLADALRRGAGRATGVYLKSAGQPPFLGVLAA